MKLGCQIRFCLKGKGNDNVELKKNDQVVPLPIKDIRDICVINTNSPLLKETEEKIFYILTFCEQGVCMGIVKHTPGDRDDNHKVIWIEIHNTIMQNNELANDLSKLIDEAVAVVNSSADRRDYSKISELLDKDYDQHIPCQARHEATDNFAIRYYNSQQPNSLGSILENLYQPNLFLKYKATMIVDEQTGITPRSDVQRLDDVLEKFSIVSVKKIRDINKIDSKTDILDASNAPLKDSWFNNNKPLEIHLKKSCFDIVTKWIKPSDCKLESSLVFTKKISPLDFKVVNEEGEQLSRPEIKYNGEKIKSGGKDIGEGDFSNKKNVIVFSHHDGYFNEEYSIDKLLSNDNTSPIVITLKRKPQTYTYTYLIPNPTKIITIEVKTTESIADDFSPITGYTVDTVENGPNNKNSQPKKLKYDNWNFLNRWRFWLCILIVSPLLIGVGIYLGYKHKPQHPPIEKNEVAIDVNNTQVTDESSPLNTSVTNAQTSNNAIDYLDNHSKWNKNEMEQIPGLKGLWDALNEYDFAKIKTYNVSLIKSQKYTKIHDVFSKGNVEKQGTFCNDGDVDITIDNYISKLQEHPQTSQPQHTPKNELNAQNKKQTTKPDNQTPPNQEGTGGGNNSRH